MRRQFGDQKINMIDAENNDDKEVCQSNSVTTPDIDSIDIDPKKEQQQIINMNNVKGLQSYLDPANSDQKESRFNNQ